MFANSFPRRRDGAALTARMLLEIKAVHFRARALQASPPASARPVYIDCRKLISYPRVRSDADGLRRGQAAARRRGFDSFDTVAGGETAGIPFAAWIAERLALPMLYIRKKPKGFGRNAQIEGDVVEGARILLVEDLTTDGRSKINFVQALRDAGAQVSDTFVVFHYGIFPQSHTNMANIGVRLHALATWWDVLRVAKENNYFDTHTLDQVEKFLNSPVEWSGAHGGIAEYPSS